MVAFLFLSSSSKYTSNHILLTREIRGWGGGGLAVPFKLISLIPIRSYFLNSFWMLKRVELHFYPRFHNSSSFLRWRGPIAFCCIITFLVTLSIIDTFEYIRTHGTCKHRFNLITRLLLPPRPVFLKNLNLKLPMLDTCHT